MVGMSVCMSVCMYVCLCVSCYDIWFRCSCIRFPFSPFLFLEEEEGKEIQPREQHLFFTSHPPNKSPPASYKCTGLLFPFPFPDPSVRTSGHAFSFILSFAWGLSIKMVCILFLDIREGSFAWYCCGDLRIRIVIISVRLSLNKALSSKLILFLFVVFRCGAVGLCYISAV